MLQLATKMGSDLSPAKALLQAARLAAHVDISSFAALAQRYRGFFQDELLLRILLTYLPETAEPFTYVGLIQDLSRGSIQADDSALPVDALIRDLDEKEARRRVKKLHLLPLTCYDAPADGKHDPFTLFVFQRTYRMNSETAMLSQLPSLVNPFLAHNNAIQVWALSTVYPYLRRNGEFHIQSTTEYSLMEFEQLQDRSAVNYLLSETGRQNTDAESLSRDLRCIISPWLYSRKRWTQVELGANTNNDERFPAFCPGWEEVQETILSWAARSWTTAVAALSRWNGPRDVFFSENATLSLDEDKLCYLDNSFVTTALACVYVTPEPTTEALRGAYQICVKIDKLVGNGSNPPDIDTFLAAPDNLPRIFTTAVLSGTATPAQMRHNLLDQSNTFTKPTSESLELATALVVSAFITTELGVPWTVRRAGDLVIREDGREQKNELMKIVRAIANKAPMDDDSYWIRCRQKVLWLHSWGYSTVDGHDVNNTAPLGLVSKEFIEAEFLKVLLSKSRYTISKIVYEDTPETPLTSEDLKETIYHSALNAFDNASNPNRNRGGLKKCDEIIHAFPNSLSNSEPSVKRIDALLKASHGLSEYRLVLKQGEPFSPVVLRVHSDPIEIIGKVLEQNLTAYTRLQEFLDIGTNMFKAGIVRSDRWKQAKPSHDRHGHDLLRVERRIIALCIEAALREDDFETAYSYVVSRLGGATVSGLEPDGLVDTWSWRAALEAGQYVRTERSQQPTHLGTATGNLEIRHLEQRIECLAMALREAPSSELQQILKTFRRCEEQLDSAIREEAAKEAAWDNSGAMDDLPGAFEPQVTTKAHVTRNMTAGAAAGQIEEAPMSLFDLSRATARAAQRNFTALSNLQSIAVDAHDMRSGHDTEPRTRKRDQLRDAATGTLVSGVGWLLGANVSKGASEAR